MVCILQCVSGVCPPALFSPGKKKTREAILIIILLRGYGEVDKIPCRCHHKTSPRIPFCSSRQSEIHVKKSQMISLSNVDIRKIKSFIHVNSGSLTIGQIAYTKSNGLMYLNKYCFYFRLTMCC